ncbi:MAG: (E)-4-hydroxy-3-methylbut-2-enyl-diphosphate synthase [Candidatus Marinimicrobia bacterium]|nr:(E)-4-hydroxy-3-methylbut-2-enyl-diphosphate synthase [Candidatus Neomarinimicrobiota bacterium]
MDNYFSKHLEILTRYQRYKTRVVNIGNVPLGGDHPIRVQSMTNTNTMDTEATVAQTIRLVDAGCELVRITAPSVKEAQNLGVIKATLADRGYAVPLIADIHFVPRAAEVAAQLVEKVRINPGNYVDRKKFQQIEYSEIEYQAEIDRIRERFTPLVRICREAGTAMRIGSNHGSLSDRILNQYGDTPLGMVESALEFVRICAEENFHDIVISMKASNTRVMIQAYRLLIDHMEQEGFNYPLHLGVTEAGDGDDARIKSALGIGSLLSDGIGDTIRVSLTEAPEAEIPVALDLVKSILPLHHHAEISELSSLPIDLFEYKRRATHRFSIIGDGQVPVVVADLNDSTVALELKLKAAGYQFSHVNQTWSAGDLGADILYFGSNLPDIIISDNTLLLYDSATWLTLPGCDNQFPLFDLESFQSSGSHHTIANFVKVEAHLDVAQLPNDPSIIWVLSSHNRHRQAEQRRFILDLIQSGRSNPIILHNDYPCLSRNELLLTSGSEAGGLLNDGLVDGIWLRSSIIDLHDLNEIAFGVLQASRSRMTRTEYIACPSCGRTLFDLEEVTAQIRARTAHLKGVKIGIMGCIVNGPGEMADADFGYVGTGPGKVSLYRGQVVVKPHIPQVEAVDSLIELIKSEGYWVEPE